MEYVPYLAGKAAVYGGAAYGARALYRGIKSIGYSNRARPMAVYNNRKFRRAPGKNRYKQRISTVELKNFDITQGSTALTVVTSTTPLLVNAVQAGTGANSMLGRKIAQKSFHIRGQLRILPKTSTALNTILPTTVRMIVFYDNQGDTAPALTDVLTLTGSHTFMAFNNLTNSDRFNILIDKTYDMGTNVFVTGNATYSSNNGCQNTIIDERRSINLPMEGPSSAGAIGGIDSGAIYVALFTNEASATSAVYSEIYTRIRFTDV